MRLKEPFGKRSWLVSTGDVMCLEGMEGILGHWLMVYFNPSGCSRLVDFC